MIGSPRAFLFAAGLLVAADILAAEPAPKSGILGRWSGSSICTKIPGNDFCRDESVVYDFVDVPDEAGRVRLKAAKVVDGRPEPMGELDFTWDPAERRWACEFQSPRAHGLWVYVARGDELVGRLYLLPDRQIARNVSARRQRS